MKIKNTSLIISMMVLVSFCMLFSAMSPASSYEPTKKNEFHYEGTYSLYAGHTDHYAFRWITPVEDIGIYEVYDKDNKMITSGETEFSRTHSVKLDKDIRGPITFKFGGKNEGLHEVHIRDEFELEATSYDKADSIYVVGDVHGRYNELINLLKSSKIIDQELNWTAGKSQIVFLGDLFDRGDDVTKVLWFIHALEEKAALKGGKVHLVLGNHEIMVMTKDLRYLSRKERNIAIAHQMTYDKLFHPTDSYLGAWLRSKVSVLKIGQIVFAHGGILDLSPYSLESFNRQAFDYMKSPIYFDLMNQAPDSSKYAPEQWYKMRDFFYYEKGPYWFRGYVQQENLQFELNAMLSKYKSKIHVVAHTPLETITERYKGKLLTTDLKEAATELLFLKSDRKKYQRFKIDSQGIKTKL